MQAIQQHIPISLLSGSNPPPPRNGPFKYDLFEVRYSLQGRIQEFLKGGVVHYSNNL